MFSFVFNAVQLGDYTVYLILPHIYDVKFHWLFNDGESKSLRPKLTELLGYLQVDTFF